MKRVLLLGGTGVFGSHLAKHLSKHPDGLDGLELIVTSRDRAKAERLAASLDGAVPVRGIAVDHAHDWRETLERERPWAVVDCSGPFQGADYHVPAMAAQAGAHVIDLADAWGYLAGYVGSLEEVARKHGVCAVAGASSTPALSGAVVRTLTEGWERVDRIDLAIVPGGRSEVGRAVLEAVLSYAGQPVPAWRDGRLGKVSGWCEAHSMRVPGLGSRRVAPVETSDAERLGSTFAVTGDVTFRAGLESKIEQWGLEALARLRRRGWAPDPRPLAGLLQRLRRFTRLMTRDVGAMVVEVQGIRERPLRRHWTLVARNGHGPMVPTMAAAATLRRLARGSVTAGAWIADDVLTLADIEAEFQPYAIECTIEDMDADGSAVPSSAPGATLPPQVAAMTLA